LFILFISATLMLPQSCVLEGFGTNIDALAKSRQVIAVHLQGHGNTADIDRPYRFEALADDVAALVAYLKLGKIASLGCPIHNLCNSQC
jgi:pimeloyl-ACP methyl ester carboxylesterase